VIAASVLIGGTGADVFQLFALEVFRLRPAMIGALLALGLFSIPVQLYGAAVSIRTPNRTLMQRNYFALLLVVIAIPFAASLTAHNRLVGIAVLGVLVVVGESANSYGWGTAWQSWIQSITQPESRGRVLANMRLVAQSTALVYITLVGALARPALTQSDLVVAAAIVATYVVVALVLYGTIPDPSAERRNRATQLDLSASARLRRDLRSLREGVRILGRIPSLRNLLLTVIMFEFLGTPLFATYMIAVLRLPVAAVGVVIAVRKGLTVASLPLWGRFVDRWGSVRTGRAGLLAFGVLSLLWLFVTPGGAHTVSGFALTVGLLLACSLILNGVDISILNEGHRRIPDAYSGIAFSLYDLIQSSLMQGVFALAGVLIGLASTGPLASFGALHLDWYKTYLVIGGGTAIAAAVILGRNVERTAPSDAVRIPSTATAPPPATASP
jgi:hypothetical protein